MTHLEADPSSGQRAVLRAVVRHAEVNPVGELTRVGGAHIRSLAGSASEAVTSVKNPSEAVLIDDSHRKTTLFLAHPSRLRADCLIISAKRRRTKNSSGQ